MSLKWGVFIKGILITWKVPKLVLVMRNYSASHLRLVGWLILGVARRVTNLLSQDIFLEHWLCARPSSRPLEICRWTRHMGFLLLVETGGGKGKTIHLKIYMKMSYSDSSLLLRMKECTKIQSDWVAIYIRWSGAAFLRKWYLSFEWQERPRQVKMEGKDIFRKGDVTLAAVWKNVSWKSRVSDSFG